MKQALPIRSLLLSLILVQGLWLLIVEPIAQAGGVYEPHAYFERTWERSDYPVAIGAVARSWFWGAAPFATFNEEYADSPRGGLRPVYYYDKSRMEITDRGSDPNSRWYVTNGLLVKEMVEGLVQVGNTAYQNLAPASVPVSGDGPGENLLSPTYASFRGLGEAVSATGRPVTNWLDRAGRVTSDSTLAARYPQTAPGYYDSVLGHNVPIIFWQFMNQRGPVAQNGKLLEDKLEDWLTAFGLPLTEAYWTHSKIGGSEKEVLVQLFQRRVLTYTPANDAGFQIEMGNVGRHYYGWRYAGATPRPGEAPAFTAPALRLVIPAISLNALIEYVGVKNDNTMDVPNNPWNVGWYRFGWQIGDNGNAVLAGHLNWYNIGPTVFANLDKLKPGDAVYVETNSGTRLTFQVIEAEAYYVNAAPIQRIFGPTDQANLNLITCNGDFDRGSASYNKRLVVYTRLVK